jgi:hypothetical protein
VDIILALLTIFVVFALPTIIVFAMVGKPERPRRGYVPSEPRPRASAPAPPAEPHG